MLDAMFARRSTAETWRLGLWVLAALIVLTVAVQLVGLLAR
jgi:hypothetical protein